MADHVTSRTNFSGILRYGSPDISQTIRSYNNQQRKKNLQNCEFRCPNHPQSKIEKKKEGKIARPFLGIEKTVEHKNDGYTNCNSCPWKSHQRIGTGTGGLRNNRTRGALLRWPEESWRLEVTCCHSNSGERPLVNADVKNSQGAKIIIIIIIITQLTVSLFNNFNF